MRASTNNTVYPNVLPSFPFLDITALSSIVSKLIKILCKEKLYTIKNGFVLYQLWLPELNHKQFSALHILQALRDAIFMSLKSSLNRCSVIVKCIDNTGGW